VRWRGKRCRLRNEDADELWRGDKINLRVGAGERSAATPGRCRPAGMRGSAAADVTRGQGDALLGGNHHVPGWFRSIF